MAYTFLTSVTGLSQPAHTIKVYYELISYAGTEIKIKIKIDYVLGEGGSIDVDALTNNTTSSKRPYIRFNNDDNNKYFYNRNAMNFTKVSIETTINEHEKEYTINRTNQLSAFTLSINGRTRAINSNGEVGNVTWNGSISIPAAGVVKIYTSEGWKNTIPYVYTNNGWKQTIPYVYTNNGWKIGT